jgi:plastocyanin
MVEMCWSTVRGALVIACAIALPLALSCSKTDSSPSPAPDPSNATITITATGASPRTLVVQPGTQVTFVNSDGAVHEMFSDPHPEHTDCPEFDSVGRLTTGQSRQTTNLVAARVCSFHDHLNPFNNSLKGSVTIR